MGEGGSTLRRLQADFNVEIGVQMDLYGDTWVTIHEVLGYPGGLRTSQDKEGIEACKQAILAIVA